MKLPAEEPGTPLELSGNRRPREMVTLDRIRLTGLLRKKPRQRGFFYERLPLSVFVERGIAPGDRRGIDQRRRRFAVSEEAVEQAAELVDRA
jgi:hypothetical protein